MPIVIYIFAISAFALGLAEFLPIGLSDVIAVDLGVSVEQVGKNVTAYALGATISAPILTALTTNWSRKTVMLTTAGLFSVGSLLAVLAGNLAVMTASRFLAGVGHGLFLAVASSTAADLAGKARAGRAVAVVFSGFTLAMAVGVPLSTWLGGIISWRWVMSLVALFGIIGGVGLLCGMKDCLPTAERQSVAENLHILFNPFLLSAALVTVFAYAGTFTAYTYIAPMLNQITGVAVQHIGIFMLIYGISAAIGNIWGGHLTDRLGEYKANILIISGIILTALLMWFALSSIVAMGVLVASLGFFTFAVVPSLQARLLKLAIGFSSNAQGIAAGLNIAGFNLGVAFGSFTGGVVIAHGGFAYTHLAAVVLSLIGLSLMLWQSKKFVNVQMC